MKQVRIALKIMAIVLIGTLLILPVWEKPSVKVSLFTKNDTPQVKEEKVADAEDPPEIEHPLVGTCTSVVVSGAVDVWIYDSLRTKVVVRNSAAAGTLPDPQVVDGALLIQGGSMDLADDDLPSVLVFCRGVAQVIHRGKGELTAHHLTGPHLRAITTGEANLRVGGEGDDCHLATSGSGDITTSWLRIAALDIAMSGSGDVEPDGEWSRLRVSQNGAGNLNVDGIRPADVAIDLTGDAYADVGLVQSLEATIQGEGRVTASGTPTYVRKHIMGKGTVDVQP